MQKNENNTPQKDENKVADQFQKEEVAAAKGWDEEKDTIAGVNDKMEKKLAEGTVTPEDLDNAGS